MGGRGKREEVERRVESCVGVKKCCSAVLRLLQYCSSRCSFLHALFGGLLFMRVDAST